MLDIKLLGRFGVALDGRPVAIPSRPAQLLLAYLLLNAGAPQPREELADILWPDSSIDNARANLRHALWQLRSAINAPADPRAIYIVQGTHDIAFNRQSAYTLDVELLERERPVWTTDALLEAAAAYGGELLPGFYESWIILERERLTVLFGRRMNWLLQRLIAERRWDDTLTWAERWIDLDEAPEPAYRAQMMAYAALGDVSRVVVAYRRCREALRVELGVEPSLETRLLVERLSRGELRSEAEGREEKRGAGEVALNSPIPGDPHALAVALTQAEVERQRADRYRLALGLATLLTAVMGVVLAARRIYQRPPR